ncbi:TIGR04076 family protein [Chloroflexota bacterium]
MAGIHDVSVKVISQEGTCFAGHKVGDEWVVTHSSPGGLCLTAFNAILSFAQVLMYGGSFPWEPDPDVTTVACPDAKNPVVFELRRLLK